MVHGARRSSTSALALVAVMAAIAACCSSGSAKAGAFDLSLLHQEVK